MDTLELGYDVPARVGMAEAEVETPCLVVDLDALERNLRRMGRRAAEMGVALRVHGKMHKCPDVALLQQKIGGAVGVCCQKVSEAEAFVRGGVTDVLVSNQVRGAAKCDRLARLAGRATVAVCIDDIANVAELSDAAARHGAEIAALVELDVGAARCGVASPAEAVEIARAIAAAPGLRFTGVQAYNGSMQHYRAHAERAQAFQHVAALVRATVDALDAAGLPPATVTGAGTGSFAFEGTSGLYTELQCGSYAFMDADYGQVLDADGARLDQTWENALFVLTTVMSHAKPDQAVCDAGHKTHAIDSGLPVVWGRGDLTVTGCSDEHGVIADPHGALAVGDRLRLIPGHCDPTCNLHDWLVGLRGGVVECLWPVTARGKTW